MTQMLEYPDNPRLLVLVGGDPMRLYHLAAVLAHMWEGAWAQGLFPELSPSRAVPVPPVEIESPVEIQSPVEVEEAHRLEPDPSDPRADGPVLPPIRSSWRSRRRRRAQLLAWVGGDLQRLQDLIETTARLWQAARQCGPEVPP